MTIVTGLTAARMIEMENQTVIDGNVVGNNLILETRDGNTINAGNVRGPIGPGGSGFQVCTSTTRPTLVAGDEGKAIYETDTDLIRMWTGTRWKLQEQIICTSSTRPTMVTADEGVMIYETDTDISRVWTGTAWQALPYNYVFADVTARDANLPSPKPGTVCYLLDCKLSQIYDGTMWRLNGMQKLGSKLITDRAGFNNNWYDVSTTGFTVPVIPKLRVRISVTIGGYLVVNSTANVVTSRVLHNASVIPGGQYGARVVIDLVQMGYQVEEVNTLTGNVVYKVEATTNYTVADIPVNGLYTVDAVAMDP